MYGQLKSTVKCLQCENISIKFDPFLTLSLPIAAPIQVQVTYIPALRFDEGSGRQIRPETISLASETVSKFGQLQSKMKEKLSLDDTKSFVIAKASKSS